MKEKLLYDENNPSHGLAFMMTRILDLAHKGETVDSEFIIKLHEEYCKRYNIPNAYKEEIPE